MDFLDPFLSGPNELRWVWTGKHADGAVFGTCPENGPIVACQVWSDHHFWPAS
ncbi:MAG: hypothetical protein QOF58_8369, partial [Pseudonocardiales bacterium]|nr:hypothetical protein [Pseudonocardiales bacterium]